MENKSVLTIPHDFEAEQAVLGSIIYNNQIINDIADILSPNCFHEEGHRHIYRAMLELNETNQPIDEILLGDQLKIFGKIEDIGGYAYLAELVDCVPSSGNIVYYAKIIQEYSLLRDLISITSDIGRKCRDPKHSIASLLIEAENKIQEIAERRPQTETKVLKDVLVECFADIEEASNLEEQPGLLTGFNDLDNLIGGLMPGDVMVIAARPGMGKSALALNIANHLCYHYKKTGYIFSREMQMKKLAKRSLMSEGNIGHFFLKSGKGTQEDWDRLGRTADKLSNSKLYLNDKTKQINEMIHLAKSYDRKLGGIDFFIFDYLQKIIGNGQRNREQEIADISARIKDLAMDLDVPVIALAQLNRDLEKRSDKHPQLSDLRESGAIEQDADIILFIYRDEVYNQDSQRKGFADIEAAKVRDGPTGMIELIWTGRYTKFSNVPKYGI